MARAQQDICADPQQACGATLQRQCLQALGAGALPAPSDACAAQREAYADCLTRVARDCAAAPGDIGTLRRSENMGVSFRQDGETVLMERIAVGKATAYRPRLAPRPFTIRVPKSVLDQTPYGYVALVAHASLTDDFFRVALAGRCWLCAEDRIWPTGGSGMADSAFGSGSLIVTPYHSPRDGEGIAAFNYLWEQRIEDAGAFYDVYVSSLSDREGVEHLRPGAAVYLTLVDGAVVDPGDAPLTRRDAERFLLKF